MSSTGKNEIQKPVGLIRIRLIDFLGGYMETIKSKIIEILHGMKTDYTDCEVLADSIINLFQKKRDELRDFITWMTGCGYDFCQHPYFVERRDTLLKDLVLFHGRVNASGKMHDPQTKEAVDSKAIDKSESIPFQLEPARPTATPPLHGPEPLPEKVTGVYMFCNHPFEEVNVAMTKLCDALYSWERSTGLESVLILREPRLLFPGYERKARSAGGRDG
jgi:hypothetical protein